MHLLYTHGAYRLGIEKVTLLADGVPVAADEHRGETGARHAESRYTVTLKRYRPGARYEVRASARSVGTDSNGEVYLSRASPVD